MFTQKLILRESTNVEKFGRYLKRNSTIQELSETSGESGESEDEESEPHVDEFSVPKDNAPLTEETDLKNASWMEKQELFLQQQLQRRTPSVESIESVKKSSDTESLELNLENLYDSPSKKSQKDLDVMDGFIKEVEMD